MNTVTKQLGEESGNRYALIFAVIVDVMQAAFFLVKDKRLDKMVLIDTLLIIVLGGVSLISGNDLIFKLKPAIAEGLGIVFMAFLVFLKPTLLATMMSRMIPDATISADQRQDMQKSMLGMMIVLSVHILLIIYAALYLSHEAWAFISGILLYILMGLYFLGMFFYGKYRSRSAAKSN